MKWDTVRVSVLYIIIISWGIAHDDGVKDKILRALVVLFSSAASSARARRPSSIPSRYQRCSVS